MRSGVIAVVLLGNGVTGQAHSKLLILQWAKLSGGRGQKFRGWILAQRQHNISNTRYREREGESPYFNPF